jgi:hypothetical protein
MGWLRKVFGGGDGTFKPELRAALEAEGLVLVEEGLSGSLRYDRFRAPGRYHNGKIVPETIALAISQKRLVVFCRSGRVKLVNSEWTSPQIKLVEPAIDDKGRLTLRIDYDRATDMAKVKGQITIRMHTDNAAAILAEIERRLSA